MLGYSVVMIFLAVTVDSYHASRGRGCVYIKP